MSVSSEIWFFLNKVLSHSCVCMLWLGHNAGHGWAPPMSTNAFWSTAAPLKSFSVPLIFIFSSSEVPHKVVQFVCFHIKLTSILLSLAKKSVFLPLLVTKAFVSYVLNILSQLICLFYWFYFLSDSLIHRFGPLLLSKKQYIESPCWTKSSYSSLSSALPAACSISLVSFKGNTHSSWNQ